MAAEPVLVKEIRQTANLMPTIGPVGHPVRSTLEVDVLSGGCTSGKDFKVSVHKKFDGQSLEIVRIHPDLCEATLHRKTVSLETEELGLSSRSPIQIVNPLYADERVVH